MATEVNAQIESQLLSLGGDMVACILSHCDFKDILSFRRTSQLSKQFSNHDWLWLSRIADYDTSHDIPIKKRTRTGYLNRLRFVEMFCMLFSYPQRTDSEVLFLRGILPLAVFELPSGDHPDFSGLTCLDFQKKWFPDDLAEELGILGKRNEARSWNIFIIYALKDIGFFDRNMHGTTKFMEEGLGANHRHVLYHDRTIITHQGKLDMSFSEGPACFGAHLALLLRDEHLIKIPNKCFSKFTKYFSSLYNSDNRKATTMTRSHEFLPKLTPSERHKRKLTDEEIITGTHRKDPTAVKTTIQYEAGLGRNVDLVRFINVTTFKATGGPNICHINRKPLPSMVTLFPDGTMRFKLDDKSNMTPKQVMTIVEDEIKRIDDTDIVRFFKKRKTIEIG